MKKVYDIIILPPDSLYINFKELRSKLLLNFEKLVNEIEAYGKSLDKSIIVKYRTEQQKVRFPVKISQIISYGKLLELSKENSIFIGPFNSAWIETSLANFEYYAYNLNKSSPITYDKFYYCANNPKELIFNILNKRTFKRNYTKKNLLHNNSHELFEIVKKILISS